MKITKNQSEVKWSAWRDRVMYISGEINDYLRNLTKIIKRIKELFYTSSN